MNSTGDDNSSPHCYLLWPGAEVGDDGHFAVIASNCLAHNCLSYSVFGFWNAQLLEKFGAVRVRIWITMSYIDFILVVHELDLESESVVEATTLLLE